MRVWWVVIKKEALQIVRNPLLLAIIIVSPVVIFGAVPGASPDKSVFRIVCIDEDGGSRGRSIVEALGRSGFFEVVGYDEPCDAEVRIPPNGAPVAVAIDAAQPFDVLERLHYLTGVLQPAEESAAINVHTMFNDTSHSRYHLIVSFLILIVSLVGTCLITLNIVGEKERGAFEQLSATTLRWQVYLGAKMLFFLGLCLLEAVAGLVICGVLWNFRVAGPVVDLMLLFALFMWPMLGLGVLIGCSSRSQLQAVYTLTFALLVMFLLGPVFSSFSSMPPWAQQTRWINPVYFVLHGARLIALKGFALGDIPGHILWLAIQGAVIHVFAARRLKRIL